jgi:hypothetical protein
MKNLKSYIEEGLLRGMDNTLDAGQAALDAAMNIDTIPTKNDFQKSPYNKDYYGVAWYCPDVLAKYKKLYPDFVESEINTLWFVLDKYGRLCDLTVSFGRSTNFTDCRQPIVGWNDGFVGATLAKYKGIAISLIERLAKNPEKLDKLMKHADEYKKLGKGNYSYKEIKSLTSL